MHEFNTFGLNPRAVSFTPSYAPQDQPIRRGRSFGNLRLAIPSANGLGPFGVINAGEPIDDTLFDHRSTNLQNPSHALLSLRSSSSGRYFNNRPRAVTDDGPVTAHQDSRLIQARAEALHIATITSGFYDGGDLPEDYRVEDKLLVDSNGEYLKNDRGEYLVLDNNGFPIKAPPKPLAPPFPFQKRSDVCAINQENKLKIYGTFPSMYFDRQTKLFCGDGSPRPTLQRPDGTFPCAVGDPPQNRPKPNGNDAERDSARDLHLQPPTVVRDHLLDFGQKHGSQTFHFCRCTGTWLEAEIYGDHVCAEIKVKNRVQAGPVSYKQAVSRKWVPGRQKRLDQKPEWTQAEKQMISTNGVGHATGAGIEIDEDTKVRDFAETPSDQNAKAFTGAIARDFARKKGRTPKVLPLKHDS